MTQAGGIYLPVVQFAASNSVGVVAPAATLNRAASPIAAQQIMCAASTAVLPIWYGTARHGALLADVGTLAGRLVMVLIWGRGPFDALLSFTLNDVAPGAGVVATHYDGTQIAPDPTMVAMYSGGYAAVLPGVVYSVVSLPPGTGMGLPHAAAIWRGRKIYDPRIDATVWSDNRGLWLADFLASADYGAGRTVDADSVAALADDCDALVGGSPRRSGGGLVLSDRQEIDAWVETLRTYAGAWVLGDVDPVRVISTRPSAPVFAFRWADGNIISMSAPESADALQQPTVVEVVYTDTSQLPWREKIASAPETGLPPSGQPYRLSQVSMPGLQDASQATREAIERHNTAWLCELRCSIEVFAEGARIEPGDRITVDWPDLGFVDKEFLVKLATGSLGRYTLDLLETDPDMASDAVVSESTVSDTALPSPTTPPSVTALAASEEVYALSSGAYSSRISASWVIPEWPFAVECLFQLLAGSDAIYTARTFASQARSPAIQEGVTYTVSVSLVTAGVFIGEPAITTITALGKLLPPSDVEWIAAQEYGGLIFARWPAVNDIDKARYEIRYSGVAGTWETAQFIDQIDGLSKQIDTIPAGTWRLFVKAIDSGDRPSASAAYCDVVVTLDTDAYFVSALPHSSPALANVAEYHLSPTDQSRRFITEDDVPWADKFPAAMGTYTNPLGTYHLAVDSTWSGNARDFGLALAGSWRAEGDVTAISGSVSTHVDLSTDAAVWSVSVGASALATARFARLIHRSSGASTLYCEIGPGEQRVRVDAVPRNERGTITSSAVGGVTVTLDYDYARLLDINLDVVVPTGETAVALFKQVDNVLLGPPTMFDIHVFDAAGSRVAKTVNWHTLGVGA